MLLAMPPVIRKERINKQRVEIMKKAIKKVNSMHPREVEKQVFQVGSNCDQRRYVRSTHCSVLRMVPDSGRLYAKFCQGNIFPLQLDL